MGSERIFTMEDRKSSSLYGGRSFRFITPFQGGGREKKVN